MDNEDEKLARLLRENETPYIDDDGFSKRVLAALPPTRAARRSRRTAIILGSASLATVLWGLLSYDSLAQAAHEYTSMAADPAFTSGVHQGWIILPLLIATGLACGLASLRSRKRLRQMP